MNDKRRIEYKPLSFTTTLRNPERIAGFLTCLKQFDGQVLTNDLIYEIVKVIIKEKLYKTMYEMSVSRLKAVYDSEDVIFNDKQLEEIIKNSPQNHKESGFDRGWPSRFDTWYKICKELGFVYYKMGEQIRISQTGYMLCDAYKNIEDNMSSKIQNVFLNALVKYQSDNPFRRNANKNVPVVLLMRLLKLLKQDKSENGAGISRKEISFVLCWGNNDAIKLFYYIKEFRKKHGFRASDDTIYASCLSLLNSTNQKRFKKVQITKEGVDDFLRKIRITGIFSIRGMGRFIDFNELEHDKINYILEKYGEYRAFNNELWNIIILPA